MGTIVVPFKEPLASSRHVTWWIKGAKILEKSYDAKSCRISGRNV